MAEEGRDLILKVNEIKVATQYGKAALMTEPVGDMLYRIQVPMEGVEEITLEGQLVQVFNIAGIRHVIKGLTVALMIETNKEDF